MSARRDWYYWRLLATGCCFILFGLGGLVLGYAALPLVSLFSRSRELATQRCRRFIQLGFRGFVGVMQLSRVLTWSTRGRELLGRPGQLIVGNHPTLIDIVFLIAMLPNATCIVKPQIFSNIFTRSTVRRAAYVSSDSPKQLLDDCVVAVTTGASLVIFPEGTRSVGGVPGRFQRGAAHVKLKANCPLALVTIQAWPSLLGKHEQWYQIPLRRPHISLDIVAPNDDNSALNPQENTASARQLTGHWRDYFVGKETT